MYAFSFNSNRFQNKKILLPKFYERYDQRLGESVN
jgi:hypothetical protein